ncbi:MAG TPA: DUF2723 domain-containing protein [Gemmatimonadaceae bacterium]|nr:DUF2723 domain-containing protein [Gemmatimonadaceae bacterium]
MRERLRAFLVPAIVAGALTIVYIVTLAPGVTLWDAGEFQSAIRSLGIPHPPGTPLYVMIGAVWARIFAPLIGFARAVNLLSALATAAGCAVLGASVARWTSSRIAGIAAGLTAGAMLSVWRSATETEVYALSLALALIALALADHAGVTQRWRDAVLAVYVLALAVPLHLSALVVAPGVVAFAATDRSGRVYAPRAVVLSGGVLLAMALGTTQPALALGSVLVIAAASLSRADVASRGRLRDGAALLAVVLLAATAVAFMYLRAQHDPFVNQGNPVTIDGVVNVVGREQYDVPALWPRRAPLWLQIGNVVQYADWQVAFGLDDWVGASAKRTPFTLLFVALGIAGAAWHRSHDRRSFRAVAVALVSASLGAVAVLNLHAGPSYGIGILPTDAPHEARERDYFFAIAFALWGAWAGIGATSFGRWLAMRFKGPKAAGATALIIAAVPIALNWRAANRAQDGPPTLAERFATALLDSTSPNAVLLVAGDNDTYPLWFEQIVQRRRPDITVVTIPLLPADWYRWELARRHKLVLGSAVDSWRGLDETIDAVAARAVELRRPLALANTVPARQREALGSNWIMRGMVYERREPDDASAGIPVLAVGDSIHVSQLSASHVVVDTTIASRLVIINPTQHVVDPAEGYVHALLNCPSEILSVVRAGRGSVDPRCNLR